jgi:UDP-glucose 4-epimerase
MRTAIVTGGAGFIGSNVVDALVARGVEVHVADDLSTGRRENLDGALAAGATLHELDVTDAATLDTLFGAVRPDAVFHLAAQIDVRASVLDPARDAGINVGGTINVVEAARRHGGPRVVLSSTGGAIYGNTDVVPTPESVAPAPLAPYGAAKLAAEQYLTLYQRLHGLSTIALRYSNVYGRRQDPLGEGGVVAIFCARAVRGETPVIYGDGLQTRDFVHVDDVVAANLTAASSAATGFVNVGVGSETTVLDLAALVRDAAGLDAFEPEHRPERPGEVRRSCLDASYAAELLGWRPEVDLREGLRRTLADVADAMSGLRTD